MRRAICVVVSILLFLCCTNLVYALSFGAVDNTWARIDHNGRGRDTAHVFTLGLPSAYDADLVEGMSLILSGYDNNRPNKSIQAFVRGNSGWQFVGSTLAPSGSSLWHRTWDLMPFADQFSGIGSFDVGYGCHYSHMSTGYRGFQPDEAPPLPTPEPGTLILLGSGLLGLAGFGRKKFLKN